MTGRTVRLWAGLKQVHVLLDGHRIKTLPCHHGRRPIRSAWPTRKTVAVTVGPGTIQVAVETSITVTAARTTSFDIRRHKASNYG